MNKSKFPTYNGQTLPSINTALPFDEPRWMIVWDDKGWTCPCRRIIVMFDGKLMDSDGNYWDHGSELPSIERADIWWKAVPKDVLKKFCRGVIPPWLPLSFDDWYNDYYLKRIKY